MERLTDMDNDKIQQALNQIDFVVFDGCDNAEEVAETIRTALTACLRNTPDKEKEVEWLTIDSAPKDTVLELKNDEFGTHPFYGWKRVMRDDGRVEWHEAGYSMGEALISAKMWPTHYKLPLNKPAPVENSGPVDDKAKMPERLRTDMLDFPTAWKIQKTVGPELAHAEKCSSVPSVGSIAGPGFLCDCGAIQNYWDGYKAADLVQPSSEGVKDRGVAASMICLGPETVSCVKEAVEDFKDDLVAGRLPFNYKTNRVYGAALGYLAALSNSVQDGENSDVVSVPRSYVNAMSELIEVAILRGDEELPHPADDPKLWTARMQDAWSEAISEVAAHEKESKA